MTGTKKVNLAFQGGGAHGAFTWGVIDKFLEDGRIEVDGISATSAGAMNAAIFTSGYIKNGNKGAREALDQYWKMISDGGKKYNATENTPLDHMYIQSGHLETPSYSMFESITGMLSPYQFNPQNKNPLRDVLEKTIDFEALRTQDKIKLRICATNVLTGKVRVFKNEEMQVDALLASACLPFLFQTVQVGSEFFWDGGYMGNPALFPLIDDTQSSDIVIIHINPIHRDEVPKTSGAIRNRVNEISFNSSLMREMRTISFITKMIDEGWFKEEYKKRLRRMYMHSVRADDVMKDLGVPTKLSTDWDFLNHLKELGRQKAEDWLNNKFDKVGQESTVDMELDYL
ncbi:MAG: patatin-like phospholipase family protein [Janthinobacterium lividum]